MGASKGPQAPESRSERPVSRGAPRDLHGRLACKNETLGPHVTIRGMIDFIQRAWDGHIVPALTDYIRIPCKSPAFDPKWAEHGHIDQAITLVKGWCEKRKVEGLRVEVVRLPGRTPVILMEVPGASDDTVLLYGHLDKQPEMVGWAKGSARGRPCGAATGCTAAAPPTTGTRRSPRITAIEALQAQRHAARALRHPHRSVRGERQRAICPPTWSPAERIGTPSLVVCLDSGCGNYEQLWVTTSLRGLAGGTLTRRSAHGRRALGRRERHRARRASGSCALAARPPGRRAHGRDHAARAPRGDSRGARRAGAAPWPRCSATPCWSKFPFAARHAPVAARSLEALLNAPGARRSAITGADGLPRIARRRQRAAPATRR